MGIVTNFTATKFLYKGIFNEVHFAWSERKQLNTILDVLQSQAAASCSLAEQLEVLLHDSSLEESTSCGLLAKLHSCRSGEFSFDEWELCRSGELSAVEPGSCRSSGFSLNEWNLHRSVELSAAEPDSCRSGELSVDECD